MADESEREDAFELSLRHRAKHTDDQGRERNDEQKRVDAVLGEELRLGADQRVDADLGQQSSEHRGDRCGSGRVGVGQPERHREDCRLDTESDDK